MSIRNELEYSLSALGNIVIGIEEMVKGVAGTAKAKAMKTVSDITGNELTIGQKNVSRGEESVASGVMYEWGKKADPDKPGDEPMDCSGGSRIWVGEGSDYWLPHGSRNQFTFCDDVEYDNILELEPGMYLAFKYKDKNNLPASVYHVGLLADNGMVIEMPQSGKPCQKSSIKKWNCIKRIPFERMTKGKRT